MNRLAIVFVVGQLMALSAVAAAPQGRRDSRADFALLHPELVADQDFDRWIHAHLFGQWREMPRRDDGKQVVIVQETFGDPPAADRVPEIASAEMFTAEIRYGGPTVTIVEKRAFSSQEVSDAYQLSEKAANRGMTFTRADDGNITVVQPAVSFGAAKPLSFHFDTLKIPKTEQKRPHTCRCGDRDALSSDDLHDSRSRAIRAEARRIVTDRHDIHRSAAELCHYVRKKVDYNTYGVLGVYTLSDALVRQKMEGQCDAKAVLLVSYLRALHIPARIKFLKWQRDGDEEDHACVEYIVKGTAFHLDPTRDVVNHPETYRCTPIYGLLPQSVLVVDADWPADARSTDSIGSYPDSDSADGLLNPWGDFCYTPNADGERRKGYSYD